MVSPPSVLPTGTTLNALGTANHAGTLRALSGSQSAKPYYKGIWFGRYGIDGTNGLSRCLGEDSGGRQNLTSMISPEFRYRVKIIIA